MNLTYGNMLAPLINVSSTVYSIVQIALFSAIALAAIAVIVIVLFQPGNSSGVGAVTGAAETFFGKNKAKSMEGKLKKWTVIAMAVILVLSVLFFLVANEVLIGVGAVVGS